MDTTHENQDTSTPKRRRLGTGRILRTIKANSDLITNYSPIKRQQSNNETDHSPGRSYSPLLPCNQVEFRSICESNNNSEISDIKCSNESPTKVEWESLDVCTSKLNEICEKSSETTRNSDKPEVIDDISNDMFHTKLEVLEQSWLNHVDQCFKDNVEESFDIVNQSICNLDDVMKNKSSLFETQDSFLLDIKDEVVENVDPNVNLNVNKCSKQIKENKPVNSFYGLPMITKGLFKSYRNIEKFYEWQEECLNLDVINKRRNLIYALPTSGGKTLVAEVLMLREVLNKKRNALFILPFVAIVQEKIWALSPFAVQLDFLVEEYAAGKGHIPPKKRRRKNSIYVATIEKGLALVRSLIELDRLHEIGLIVIDELHLIGEKGRGGNLETLLTTVLFTKKDIQIVGMSATIGNLHEIAQFLHADVFQREFRPVELIEYVKLGDVLHRIVWGPDGVEVVPDRELVYDYSAAAKTMDPDLLGGLVSEVVPKGSCLVFCSTKRNCENVAVLLCKLQRREMMTHRKAERQTLEKALRSEGANAELVSSVRYGIAFHHAGLASDERAMIEQAYRSGVISVICCTSTLAAGVNLPAQRVIVRAPLVGRDFITLGAYRQMVGRAGRAGVCDTGESIVICGEKDWPQLQSVLRGGLAPARSMLGAGGSPDIKTVCDNSLRSLIQCGALEVVNDKQKNASNSDESRLSDSKYHVYNYSELAVSKLGKASIKGCMDLSVAKQLLIDLERASKGLVLMGSLHLLYLVTPHDAAGIKPDYAHYYALYGSLDEEGVQTARMLGITELNAIRMMTGKPIKNLPEKVLCRFYLALMLHDLWKQVPFHVVAQKYNLPRGTVQSVMASSAAFASCAQKFCEEMEQLWPFKPLLGELAAQLQHCAAPELQQLMELPGVKKARAMQLVRGGFRRVEDVARASVARLLEHVAHLTPAAAGLLVTAARMSLIEKVENLRAEAEEVMEELNV